MPALPLFLAVALAATPAEPAANVTDAPIADPAPTADSTLAAPDLAPSRAWSRPFAVGAYVAGRGGAYTAGGVGGRARIQPFRHAGLDLYLELTAVDWPGGFRHDYPNGFSVFAAVPLGPVQLRPYFGFCDVISLVEPTQPGAPRADDVMLGAHAGVGADVAVSRSVSLFVDAQADLYAGHDRSSGGWTGDVAEDLVPMLTGQVNAGLQLHFADPR